MTIHGATSRGGAHGTGAEGRAESVPNFDRQRRIEEVFKAALAAHEEGGAALSSEVVCRECAGDDDLRAEVLALLGVHEGEDGLLDRGNPLLGGTLGGGGGGGSGGLHALAEEDAPLASGSRLGRYTIAGVLGAGGMGVVYKAEQEQPRRTVALKVIRSSVARPSMLRRFEHEAEVLGRLQHPGIAQIYEAGTAQVARPGDGAPVRVPFLAMELVEGPSLIEHADRAGLGVRERLELARLVCEAVQHAHQKGIIHRDLKPSNILVARPDESGDTIGRPKILDFGVARAADVDSRMTLHRTGIGQLIGTLPYMSPEQVSGGVDSVDTRTDVYALGVIIYQLLTGKLPHDVSSRPLPEAARVIRDEHPSRLSAVNPVFRGDIDTIVSKAMEKDRQRRYQSAEELGEDIRRFLAEEPIQAKRDSAMYVLRKQMKRYRLYVVGASVFLLLLAASAVVAAALAAGQARLARKLEHELACANIERGRALGLAGSAGIAEKLLWREALGGSAPRLAHWALWSNYARRPLRRSLAATDMQASRVAVSADGSVVIVANSVGRVQGWDAPLQNLLWDRTFHPSYAPIDVSGDGSLLAVAQISEPIRILDGRTGNELHAFEPPIDDLRCIALSPDGSVLVCGARHGHLAAIDTRTGETRLKTLAIPNCPAIFDIAFAPDGSVFGLVGGRTAQAWDSRTLTRLHDLASGDERPNALAFSGDGSRMLVALESNTITVYDTKTWEALPRVGPMSESIHTMCMSSDGRTLVVGVSGGIEVRDMPSGTLRSLLASQETGSTQVSFYEDETAIITTGLGAPARIWDLEPFAAKSVACDDHDAWVMNLVVHPDGRVFSSDFSGRVSAWRSGRPTVGVIPTGREFRPVRGMGISSDGSRLAVAPSTGWVRLYDANSYVPLSEQPVFPDQVYDLAFTADDRRLLCGGMMGEVVIADAEGLSAPIVLRERGDNARIKVAASPDGRWFAATGLRDTLSVWDARTLKCVFRVPGEWASHDLAFSPDSKTLAFVTAFRIIELYETGSWTRLAELEGHPRPSVHLAFLPDSRTLASVGGDGKLRLWDVGARRELLDLPTSADDLSAVAVSPDGRFVYCASQDENVYAWDLWHYDRHIAGNLEFMAQRLLPEMNPRPRIDHLREWAATVDATGQPCPPPVQ